MAPTQIRNKENRGLRVFTPFWRRVQALGDPPKPLPAPKKLNGVPNLASDALEDWELEPVRPDWAGGLRESWQPGEASAQARLKPSSRAASPAIPAIATGPIATAPRACRRICVSARSARAKSGTPRALRRPSTLACQPISKNSSANSAGANSAVICCSTYPISRRATCSPPSTPFPGSTTTRRCSAWQRGRTGYPIVDAGMRELWHTGVMHNRVRMVVASFLVKHLLIDWREGEQWFWDTLVDADAGSNPANWQWVAGSGADAAPYFRVFNPILQGEKFDPDGVYVRRWVPELRQLPDRLIHQPWTATPLELASAGVELGKTYPQPIIDHKTGRERALRPMQRSAATRSSRARRVDQKHRGGAGHHADDRDGIEPLVEQHIGHQRGHRRHQIEQARHRGRGRAADQPVQQPDRSDRQHHRKPDQRQHELGGPVHHIGLEQPGARPKKTVTATYCTRLPERQSIALQ